MELSEVQLEKVRQRVLWAQALFLRMVYIGDHDIPSVNVYAKWPSKWKHSAGVYDGNIHIDGKTQLPELCIFHEMSHFLDAKLLPGRGYTSLSEDIRIHLSLSDWRRSVNRSLSVSHLRLWLKNPKNKDKNYTCYLLGYEEIMARSLTQYLVLRGNHPAMLGQLKWKQPKCIQDIYQCGHWSNRDFSLIYTNIENILSSQNLLK